MSRIDQSSPEFIRGELLVKIRELERQQHRPLRELALDPTNAAARDRVLSIETAIAALRKQLA